LVDDLLDVSRISSGKLILRKEQVSMQSILSIAMEATQGLFASKRQRVQLEVCAEPLFVNGDPTRLTQVVTNLLNNAAKYTDEEGHITVSLLPEQEEAVLRVTDNGIGIDAATMARVFELFVQADAPGMRSGGGLGIGLNIARRLAHMHHGRLEGSSPGLGMGSTFMFRLPLLRALHNGNDGRTRHQGGRQSSYRVLVVDDNRDAAQSMAALLRMLGQQVHVAYDGLQAIALGRETQPDLVIMDIGMPVMSGLEACKRMRGEPWGHQAHIVALSGWGQEHDRQRGVSAGFDDHLIKPIELATLRALLSSLGQRATIA
jgi:CheY-like chemotaxis protein/two-component sensor histidine kinase